MAPDPPWAQMLATTNAATAGNIGALLRTARTAAGLNLQDAARLVGCSPSTLSRPHLLGLAASPPPPAPGRAMVAGNLYNSGGDGMRRRELLAGSLAAALPHPPTLSTTATLVDVLFGRATAAPLPVRQLAAQVGAAWADFRACRFTQLSRRLPNLIASADAGQTPTLTAQAYTVATRLLTKLHDDGLACVTADRAVRAGRASNDTVAKAHATLAAAVILRRTGHPDRAQALMVDSAEQLRDDTGLTSTQQLVMYGRLLASAAYTAAVRDQRDEAWALLADADHVATSARAGPEVDDGGRVDLAVYKVSVARVLGDYGTAVHHASLINPTHIGSPERRARFWEDTALAMHGRGRPEAAFRALLAAEQAAPQEVRYRPWAQDLVRALLGRTRPPAGLRDFAARVGATE